MSYFKNNLYRYYKLVVKLRIAIITVFSLIFLYLVFNMTTLLTHNDDELWLQGSNEYTRLLKNNHKQNYAQKLRLKLGSQPFSTKNISKMKLLHSNLEDVKEITRISSPLTHTMIYSSDNNEGSSLVGARTLRDNSVDEIIAKLKNSAQEFSKFYSSNKETLYIYVFSSSPIDFSDIYIPFDYDVIATAEGENIFKDTILFSILVTTLFILFSIAFRTIIPSILGIIFISFNTLFTVSAYQFIQPDTPLHVSILLVAIAVSIMDFIYIYYGWHIMQISLNNKRAIYYTVMKTFKPIILTTFVSVVGIGALIFQNSVILQSIGYNVILSSIIGFILTFSFLLALLSFFNIKDPYMITKNTSKLFAGLEAKYERNILRIFLLLTGVVFISSVVFTTIKPSSFITEDNDEVVSLLIPSNGLTHEALKKLERFHGDITRRFQEDISDITSSYTYAKSLSMEYDRLRPFEVSNINLDFISFDFILYDIYDDVMENSAHRVTIYLEDDSIDKNIVLQWIREWDKENTTLLDDVDSLLSAAKYDTVNHMIFVVLFILVLITLVIYTVTKNKVYAFIALTVNTIPLVWFFAILIILQIPLSIEVLVAMLIMVALSSDATIHFLYYYHKHLRPGYSNEHSLEVSFIEVGTPVGIGSTILLITFLLLVFANIPTISTIGKYSVILIIFSLWADLLILPVMFIEMIKSK
jgi:predicted RND superfamily exporter protein